MSLISELSRRNVLRVAAAYAVTSWLLIQVAETIFPLFGFDESPARIVVVILAVGFVPALVFAWVFEFTPEGLKREADLGQNRPLEVEGARKFDRVIALVLALALGYFAFDKFVLDPARDATLVEETVQQVRSDVLVESFGENSIAVLPFENLSNDPEQEYFSDGMAEELLNLLAQVPRLRVISRSSAFAFKGQPINIPTIARQLGVNHVLEGSVRKSGDRVRITAQLIEARSDSHLWSQTYERQLDDIFAIQDEISAAIVRELGAKLAFEVEHPAEERAPANTEAYEAYLRGRHLMAQRTPEALVGAVEEFRKAVDLDPDYALGHASLAIALGLRGGSPDLSEAEAVELARPHALKAVALDPSLAEAHAALGWVAWMPDTLAEAEGHFRDAVQLNPGYADAVMWLGHFLMMRNEYSESFVLYQKASQIDPLSVPARNSLINGLVGRGRIDEARQELEKMASLHEWSYSGWKIYLESLDGNWADATIAILDGLQKGQGGLLNSLQVMLALMGLEDEALGAHPGQELSPFALAEMGSERIQVLRLSGQAGLAIAQWEQTPEGLPQTPGPGYIQSGLLLAAAGDQARAGPVLETIWQVFNGSVGIGTPSRDANFVLALMAVRQARGDDAGVEELALALQESVQRYSEAGLVQCDYVEGCVFFDAGISAYLDGDREKGLAEIARAVESGYYIPPKVAYLQFLYDDPGFAPILVAQKAHQAEEREKLLAVVCTDNPYADVWQPAVQTCEAYPH